MARGDRVRPEGVSRKQWARWKLVAQGYRVHGVVLEPPRPRENVANPRAVEQQYRRAMRNQKRIEESYD